MKGFLQRRRDEKRLEADRARREKAQVGLADEVVARVQSMADTGDIPPEERLDQALEDIWDLSAEDHGCYIKDEIDAWNDIRKAARYQLRKRKSTDG